MNVSFGFPLRVLTDLSHLGEAKEMAEDFEKIMNERFPVELFALHMAHAPGMTIEAAEGAVFVSVFALS